MWRHHQSGQGGRGCEQSEEDQTQSVYHHGGKLPVGLKKGLIFNLFILREIDL